MRLPCLFLASATTAVAEPATVPPPPEAVWDLTDLFADESAWEAEFAAVTACWPQVSGWAGRLGESPAVLRDALALTSDLQKRLARLSVYASLKSDEDTRVAPNLGRQQRVSVAWSRYSEARSFIAPELLALGADKVRAMFAAEPALAPWRFPVEDILRLAPHTLSTEAEAVMAATGLLSSQPSDVYTILANADLPWPTIELVDGTKIVVDQSAYTKYRADPDRENRRRVFVAFWSAWKTYERTFGTLLNAEVMANLFAARQRHYPNALSWALAADHVPEAVYRTLLAETRAALPLLHRTFRLRGKLLGIDDLHYHDMYPPVLVPDDLPTFTLDASRELTTASLAPLGEDYVTRFDAAARGRWMHVYPAPGKKTGAYMAGSAYDVHPYVLLNHQDDFDGLSTYTHEWGHAMHSVLANEAQPYPTAGYSIFTAEIASITHELLLSDHLIGTAKTKAERLYYLGEALEMVRGTYFRQVMFADFELKIHEAAEAGEALTGERLTEIYAALLKDYHGHAEGVMKIEDHVTLEWAFIPHFYYDFYVFQYATSLAGSAYFAEQLAAGAPGAAQNWIQVLQAGGSDHPYEILRRAGLDLASPEPYRALARRHERILNEIEALLAEKD